MFPHLPFVHSVLYLTQVPIIVSQIKIGIRTSPLNGPFSPRIPPRWNSSRCQQRLPLPLNTRFPYIYEEGISGGRETIRRSREIIILGQTSVTRSLDYLTEKSDRRTSTDPTFHTRPPCLLRGVIHQMSGFPDEE